MMSAKSEGKPSEDINELLNNLSLKDPAENIAKKVEIKLEPSAYDEAYIKNSSSEDSGYEDDKEARVEKSELEIEAAKTVKCSEDSDQQKDIREGNSNDELSSDDNNIKDELSTKPLDDEEKKLKKGHQDLILTGDQDETEKEDKNEECEVIEAAGKAEKDVEDAGYIRRTGKTLLTPGHEGIYGQDALYFNMNKSFALDEANIGTEDNYNQYNMSSPQSFSSYLLSSDSVSMNNYATPQSNQGYYYSDSPNTGLWYDSPQSSPSPYQNDSAKREFKNIYQDSDSELNSCSGNSYLTPPPSVSPPKQFLDGSSPCHQSCIQIVDLIDKVDQSAIGGSGPEDELKNLLSALDCEQDSSLWGMSSFMGANMNQQSNVYLDGMPLNKGAQYPSDNSDPVSKMWKDIQETDSNELSVYLTNRLDVDETERAVVSVCDPQTLFDFESQVSAVLSNNPMAEIIPDDQQGDTNLIVLSSRDEDRRDKIVEKIYALAKGLSQVQVCCKAPVENFHCLSCGNSNPESFHTPLTLSNIQGYTALFCAVRQDYPAVIVKYMVALIQTNKLDVAREFSGHRNKLYLSSRKYPWLSTYAAEYAPLSW